MALAKTRGKSPAVDDAKLPLLDHLTELRTRIIRVILAWILGAVLAWNFSEQIFGLLLELRIDLPPGFVRGALVGLLSFLFLLTLEFFLHTLLLLLFLL